MKQLSLLQTERRTIMKKKLVIVGAGETASNAYEYFTYDSEYDVVAFAVSKVFRNGDVFHNCPLIDFEDMELRYPPDEYDAFVALGYGHLNRDRTKLYHLTKEKGYRLASYLSSRAFIWRNVEIGENCFILANNTLEPFTKVGNNVVMWSGNHLGHSSIIKDNCFIASQVVISGFCEIGANTFIGVNAAIADNIKIASDNYIAMGCVINKDTQENAIYKGNPAVISKISAKAFCKVKD